MSGRHRVAVLGLGRMGAAMTRVLRRADFEVIVWNRTRSTAEALANETGAEVSGSATEALNHATVVISSLADDRAVEEVFRGRYRAAAALSVGAVVLEMSTIAPQTVHETRHVIEQRGASLLDAPVSGSVSLAEAGDLTVMVGGDPAALERVRPVLEALSGKIFHVGPSGAGATMKLAVNALVHAIDVALSEALVLAEKAGVARSVAYDVFAGGAAAAPFVLYKRGAFERPEDAPVAFSVDLMAKDLDLILQLADEVGLRMDQAATNRRITMEAIAAGFGRRDMSSIAMLLREGVSREPGGRDLNR